MHSSYKVYKIFSILYRLTILIKRSLCFYAFIEQEMLLLDMIMNVHIILCICIKHEQNGY